VLSCPCALLVLPRVVRVETIFVSERRYPVPGSPARGPRSGDRKILPDGERLSQWPNHEHQKITREEIRKKLSRRWQQERRYPLRPQRACYRLCRTLARTARTLQKKTSPVPDGERAGAVSPELMFFFVFSSLFLLFLGRGAFLRQSLCQQNSENSAEGMHLARHFEKMMKIYK